MYYRKTCVRMHNITIYLIKYQKYEQYKMLPNLAKKWHFSCLVQGSNILPSDYALHKPLMLSCRCGRPVKMFSLSIYLPDTQPALIKYYVLLNDQKLYLRYEKCPSGRLRLISTTWGSKMSYKIYVHRLPFFLIQFWTNSVALSSRGHILDITFSEISPAVQSDWISQWK